MFKVYGRNPELARKKAVKKVDRYIKVDKQDYRRTDDEMDAEIKVVAAAIFERQKPESISAELSNPTLCREFMKMAEKDGCLDMHIRIKVPVQTKDAKGRVKIAQRFIPWVDGNDYSDPVKNAAIKA